MDDEALWHYLEEANNGDLLETLQESLATHCLFNADQNMEPSSEELREEDRENNLHTITSCQVQNNIPSEGTAATQQNLSSEQHDEFSESFNEPMPSTSGVVAPTDQYHAQNQVSTSPRSLPSMDSQRSPASPVSQASLASQDSPDSPASNTSDLPASPALPELASFNRLPAHNFATQRKMKIQCNGMNLWAKRIKHRKSSIFNYW